MATTAGLEGSWMMSERVEEGWLIEMIGSNLWWTGTCWTANADEAVRFCRKRDAEQAAKAWGLKNAWTSDHMWIPKRGVSE